MYARDKVRPKLYDMDQEKMSRLFADLRRESMATGSYPITIRHLESMIRMAEASAKMALREYVRPDDIDLAISVAVGSFVSAQKMSIKKTLERVCKSKCFQTTVNRSLRRASASTSPRPGIMKSCSHLFLGSWSRRKLASTSFRDTSNQKC